MRRLASIGIALMTLVPLWGCEQPPQHTNAWLSYKYGAGCGSASDCNALLTDDQEALRYYEGLGIAEPYNYTFAQWRADNGFPEGDPPAHAIYANLADLRIGRDMNCVQNGLNIACYVVNYGLNGYLEDGTVVVTGPPLRDDLDKAINNAINKTAVVGTVAMVYRAGVTTNGVSFYVFSPDGNLLPKLTLDHEGDKNVPRMCMACHGGAYDTATHTVTGAAFLPFDVFAFQYGTTAGHKFDDEQEGLRLLNGLVAATQPPQAIRDLIGGLYPDGSVTTAGALAQDGWVPPKWSGNPTLYSSVIRPYCRMCHVAQQPISLDDLSFFEEIAPQVKVMVCDKHDMPHAEVPYGGPHDDSTFPLIKDNPLYKIGFWWDATAQRDLGKFFKSLDISSCLPD